VAVFGEHGPAPAYLTTEITRRTSALLVDAARTTLAHRGYRVAAELGWDGTAVLADGRRITALDSAEMAELYRAISEDRPPAAGWLARVQEATGTQAAIVVAGYGEDVPDHTAEKVATGIIIGLFIVLVAIALIATHHSGSSRKEAPGAPHVATPIH